MYTLKRIVMMFHINSKVSWNDINISMYTQYIQYIQWLCLPIEKIYYFLHRCEPTYIIKEQKTLMRSSHQCFSVRKHLWQPRFPFVWPDTTINSHRFLTPVTDRNWFYNIFHRIGYKYFYFKQFMVIFLNILSCFFIFSNDMELLEFCMVFVIL